MLDNTHPRKHRGTSLSVTADLRLGSSPLNSPHSPVIKLPRDKLVLTSLPSSRAMLLTSFTALYPRIDATDHHYIRTMDLRLSLNHLTKWTGSFGQKATLSMITKLLFTCIATGLLMKESLGLFGFLRCPAQIILLSLSQGDVEESCLILYIKPTSIPGPAPEFRVLLGKVTNTSPQRSPF